MTNNLMVGYARVNATPMLGIRMRGYYRTRRAEAILDEIEICAIGSRLSAHHPHPYRSLCDP